MGERERSGTRGKEEPHAEEAVGEQRSGTSLESIRAAGRAAAARMADAERVNVPDFGSYNPLKQQERADAFIAFAAARHGAQRPDNPYAPWTAALEIHAAFNSLNLYQQRLARTELQKRRSAEDAALVPSPDEQERLRGQSPGASEDVVITLPRSPNMNYSDILDACDKDPRVRTPTSILGVRG